MVLLDLLSCNNLVVKFSDYGLIEKKITPDGSCLFSAFSEALYGTENYHGILRKMVCDYYASLKFEDAKKLLHDKEPKWNKTICEAKINRMREPTTWGGEPELHTLAKLLEVEVFLFGFGGVFSYPNSTRIHSIMLHYCSAKEHQRENHYNLLLDDRKLNSIFVYSTTVDKHVTLKEQKQKKDEEEEELEETVGIEWFGKVNVH
jgi:hypothetical protein